MEETTQNQPANRDLSGRNSDGTFKLGISGNSSGRPKGTIKDYLRRRFMDMPDEEKEQFLKSVSHDMQIRLAEGNPQNNIEHSGKLTISQVLDELEGSL